MLRVMAGEWPNISPTTFVGTPDASSKTPMYGGECRRILGNFAVIPPAMALPCRQLAAVGGLELVVVHHLEAAAGPRTP
jgi:hypothetical protein